MNRTVRSPIKSQRNKFENSTSNIISLWTIVTAKSSRNAKYFKSPHECIRLSCLKLRSSTTNCKTLLVITKLTRLIKVLKKPNIYKFLKYLKNNKWGLLGGKPQLHTSPQYSWTLESQRKPFKNLREKDCVTNIDRLANAYLIADIRSLESLLKYN